MLSFIAFKKGCVYMIPDNIRKLRKKNHMSQDELAEKLGVSRQSVSLWENGQTQPTIENIIALAKVFDVSSDEILMGTDAAGNAHAAEPTAVPTTQPTIQHPIYSLSKRIISKAAVCSLSIPAGICDIPCVNKQFHQSGRLFAARCLLSRVLWKMLAKANILW